MSISPRTIPVNFFKMNAGKHTRGLFNSNTNFFLMGRFLHCSSEHKRFLHKPSPTDIYFSAWSPCKYLVTLHTRGATLEVCLSALLALRLSLPRHFQTLSRALDLPEDRRDQNRKVESGEGLVHRKVVNFLSSRAQTSAGSRIVRKEENVAHILVCGRIRRNRFLSFLRQ